MSARTSIALLLGVALLAATGRAAEEKSKSAKVFNEADVEAAWHRRIPELRIDGLPLNEVARYLFQRGEFPEVNFVVPPSARDVVIPMIELRSVTLDEILTAIELASDGHIRASVHGDVVPAVDAAGLPIVRRAVTSPTNLVAFTFTPPPDQPQPQPRPAACRVFSLANYLASKSEEDSAVAIKNLYDAFEISWKMLKEHDRDVRAPSLTIHHGTRLLIAVGRERELAVIEQIIKELQGSASSKTVTAPADESGDGKQVGLLLRRLNSKAVITNGLPAKP